MTTNATKTFSLVLFAILWYITTRAMQDYFAGEEQLPAVLWQSIIGAVGNTASVTSR
jgi:hypothetical protein